jgi:hypothetical protein
MGGKPLFSPEKNDKTLEEREILHHDTAVFFRVPRPFFHKPSAPIA